MSPEALIEKEAAYYAGVPMKALFETGGRHNHEVLARQLVFYCLHCFLSLPYHEIGKMYGKDQSTVQHSVRKVEDLRDEGELDRWLFDLETQIKAMPETLERVRLKERKT